MQGSLKSLTEQYRQQPETFSQQTINLLQKIADKLEAMPQRRQAQQTVQPSQTNTNAQTGNQSNLPPSQAQSNQGAGADAQQTVNQPGAGKGAVRWRRRAI